MDHSLGMDVDQPFSDASKLENYMMDNESTIAKVEVENLQARTGLHLDGLSRSR